MTTLFCCDICRTSYPSLVHAEQCEKSCLLIRNLQVRLSSSEWCPAIPIHRLSEWTKGDKVELARVLLQEFDKLREAEEDR
jgi:hypothetical protein